MVEYIEREALLLRLNDIWLTAKPTDTMYDDDRQLAMVRCMGLNDAMDAVKSIPAADVVPMSWVREHMSGDYISREQAVENAIDQMRHSASETAMRERLMNLVAADVRPVVRGRWIETRTGFHCSACKSKAKGTKDGALLSNFCPNCGADMREES